jgi:hypothetical protein
MKKNQRKDKMKEEVLFYGVKDKHGNLWLELCDASIAYKMDKKFWRKIVNQIKRGDLEISGSKYEPIYRERVLQIVDMIKEGLRNWK